MLELMWARRESLSLTFVDGGLVVGFVRSAVASVKFGGRVFHWCSCVVVFDFRSLSSRLGEK